MKKNAIQQSDKQTIESTAKEDFKPTPHMLHWLNTQVQTQSDVIDQIARDSGIDESSWYKWLKQEHFEDWYWGEYDKMTRRWKPTVDAIGLRFAKKGSPQHFEYLAKRVGNIREKGEATVPVQINNFIRAEKDEFGI